MTEGQGGTDAEAAEARIITALSAWHRVDFKDYKRSTLRRRVARRAALARVNDPSEYASLVESNEAERELLATDMLIDVTEFFRDSPAWDRLEPEFDRIVAESIAADRALRLWSQACATGEEVYSLAILATEAMERADGEVPIQIFATDVHERSLTTADEGRYEEAQLVNVSPERRERFFTEIAGRFQVKPELRSLVTFATHNAIEDAPFLRIDLIACRNFLIYLQPSGQERALDLVFAGLRIGGVLFLGPSESPGDTERELEPIDRSLRIFRKLRDTKSTRRTRLPRGAATHQARPAPSANRTDLRLIRAYDSFHQLQLTTGFLVDEAGELLHTFGRGERLLSPPSGRRDLQLTSLLVHPSVRVAVESMLTHLWAEDGSPTRRLTQVPISIFDDETDDEGRLIEAVLAGSIFSADDEQFATLRFDPAPTGVDPVERIDVGDATTADVERLLTDLAHARENLRIALDRNEITNNQLAAANEALVAANEELQSTNEELQSFNQELVAVNSDHQRRLDQVLDLSADLEQILDAAEIAALLLNDDGTIRRASAAAQAIFRVRESDIGRPFADFATTLDRGQLLVDIRDVARGADPITRRVEVGEPPVPRTLLVDRYDLPHNRSGVFLAVLPAEEMGPAEDEYRRLLEQSPISMYAKDAEGRYVTVNKFAREATESAVGLTVADFLPPEVAEAVMAHDREVAASGEPAFIIEQFPRADGSMPRWLTMKFPMGDGTVGGLSMPITAGLEAATSELGPFFQFLQELPVGMLTVDANDRVVAANKYMTEVSGLLPGMHPAERYSEDVADQIVETHQMARARTEPFLQLRRNPTPVAGNLPRLALVFPLPDGQVGQLIIPVTRELEEIGGQLGPGGSAFLEVFQDLPVGILAKDKDDVVTAINDYMRNLAGIDIGMPMSVGVSASDRPIMESLDAAVRETGGLVTRVVMTPRDDPSNDPVLILAFPVGDEGIGRVMIEIDESLADELQGVGPGWTQFRRVVDTMPIAMIAKDADGVFTMVNEFGRYLGGVELGKTEMELFGPEIATELEANDDIVRRTQQPHYFLEELPTEDGDLQRVITVEFPMPANGVGAVSIALEEPLREIFADYRRYRQVARLAYTLGGRDEAGGWRPLIDDATDLTRERADQLLSRITEEDVERVQAKIEALEADGVANTILPGARIRLLHTPIENDPEIDMIAFSVDESDLLGEIAQLRERLREAGVEPDVD